MKPWKWKIKTWLYTVKKMLWRIAFTVGAIALFIKGKWLLGILCVLTVVALEIIVFIRYVANLYNQQWRD